MKNIIVKSDTCGMWVKGMNLDDFKNDRKTIDAVVRNLEIIGEAARNIPEEVKSTYQEIDWKGMIGLRNRIAHEYFGVSTAIIWNVIKQEIPPIKEKIKSILNV